MHDLALAIVDTLAQVFKGHAKKHGAQWWAWRVKVGNALGG